MSTHSSAAQWCHSVFFHPHGYFRKLIGAVLVWAMVMTSLPAFSANGRRTVEWAGTWKLASSPLPPKASAEAPTVTVNPAHSSSARSKARLVTRTALKSAPALGARLAATPLPSMFPTPSAATPETSANLQLDLPSPDLSLLARPLRSSMPLLMMQSSNFAVYVGYADDVRANPNFPVPWQGSPNTTFIGAGPSFDAGAIRLDNTSSSPITVSDVFVTVPGWTTSSTRDANGNGTADLWGSFTIAPNSTVILTQTGEFNFDTSDFGINGCGNPIPDGQSPFPTVKITINGTAATFNDTGHVLDTGAFDLACRGNESLQWRLIGTSGIENSTGHITLAPPSSVQAAGANYTATAQVTDAGGQPTPNVTVNFVVLSGPDAGKTGTGATDSEGNATFTYTSNSPGTDILQASVTNVTGGSIQSEQVTTTWTSVGPCPSPSQPPAASASSLVYAGQTAGEFNDPLTLAAQLTDGNGNPLSNRSLSFVFGSQTFNATTDGNGVAKVNVTNAPAPGSVPLTVSFAGETNFSPAQASTSITIGKEETAIRYIGKTLLGTAVPQQVIAVLTDGVDQTPIANETVTFQVGSVSAQAVTNSSGIATTMLTLGPAQTSGPASIQVSFAGDSNYKPSLTGIPILIYLSTSFVVWGGNAGGLQLGQDVNFWGHSWADQVTGGNFTDNPSFKGFADPVNQVHVCEASAGTGGPLDDQCWSSKTGQSFPPPLTLPAYIEVIVSTAITQNSSEVFGNIAAAAVCKVDQAPPYEPDPGHPGFCHLTAIVEDGANIFPNPPALMALQSQPPTVLPAQNFTVTTNITNDSVSQADSVVVSESFDGMTPATGSQTFGSILNQQQQAAGFQETTPAIPARQSNETSVAYQARLAAVDGRLFTSTGTITFTDNFGEPFVPIPVSSFSRLQLPRLTLGISGPSCVGPGTTIPYKVTITNIGSADASNVILLMQMPDGSTVSVPIALIPVGTSVTETVNFVVPAITGKQPNETDQQYLARLASIDGTQLTAIAHVTWQDTIGNDYGPIDQQFISTTERVPIVTVTPVEPSPLLPIQTATSSLPVQNTGGGNASQVFLVVTNPDGSIATVPTFALPGGQAAAESSTFTVPAVAAKGASEIDSAYIARLSGIDNNPLNFVAQLNWVDASGNNYGPTHTPFQSVEVLPILTVMFTGPGSATAGDKITYSITLTNNGHATATITSIPVTLPDGSVQNVVPPQTSLAPGASTSATVNFTVSTSQAAGNITATASITWQDANNNTYGPLSPMVVTQVAGLPPAVLASCLPTSSLAVLTQGNTVTSYVPNGSWGNGATGIRFVPVEGTGPTAAIPTRSGVNSCSSNSVTGQTVCTANNTDVYLLTGTSLTNTLTSSSNGSAGFSGGSCQNCGVAINAATNQAVIAMGLSGGAGIQFLDLNTNTFETPVPTSTGRISEDISVDPSRNVILTPSEDGNYGLFTTGSAGVKYFTNLISGAGEFDSSAEDCTTGIALAPTEFSGRIFIADLTQITFTPGSPAGTWTAPSQTQNFPEFGDLAAGTSGMAVAPGSHLAIVTGEFGGNAFGVVQLPVTSGTGTPAITDYVLAFIPNEPTGAVFSNGLDPHTVTAYTSPTSGKAFGLVADGGPNFLAVIDLQALLSAKRSAPHTVDSSVDLVGTGIIRFIATAPTIITASPNTGKQQQQNLAVTITALATHFVQGTTTVSFGAGITVTSVTVNSPTSATATLNIDPLAFTGFRNVTVTTGSETATLGNGFNVTAGPATITQAAPKTGQQGQQGLTVTVTGQNTHFIAGTTNASFDSGIAVTSLTVNSPTSATAVLNIEPLTAPGTRQVTLNTDGESASSVNVFAVTAGPATLTQLSPNTGPQGAQKLSVTITGQSTHFTQNETSANFGSGISVQSVTVSSPTLATAVINIQPTAALGARTVSVFTLGETATLTNAFTVVAGTPVVVQVTPISGQQGQQNLSVSVTGAFTHWVPGTTTASFGAGVTVSSLTINSPISATAVLNIDPAAATGAHNVTFTTGSEVATLIGGFTVNPGTPVLLQVSPNTGGLGQQNLSIVATAMFTHFVQGNTFLEFSVGGISIVSTTVNSPTSVTFVINIAPNTSPGPREVVIFDSTEEVFLNPGFTVTTTPLVAQVSPNAAQQGTSNLSVLITGQNTHFVQGTSVASFGAGITVASLTVNSSTSATAVISIDPAAAPGFRTVSVSTGAEVATLVNGFTVLPPPPTVSTNLPEGTVMTNPTAITGSVTSGSWKLQYALASADGTGPAPVFTTFASGTNAVNNGTLGTIDPTTLLNGNYIIQLTSTDQFGQTTTVFSNAVVQGNTKVGNFTLTFNDLTVSEPGLPITVTRTYDSRDKASHDFGFGWTLSLVNVRVQKNGVLGANWQMSQSGGLLPTFCLQESRPHIVTIIFPDNTVYKFEASTSPQCQEVAPIETANLIFNQLPTTALAQGATLQIVGDNSALVNPASPGPVDLIDIDTLNDVNQTTFQLTTAAGFTYVIDQTLGATSVTDPNGNTLTINSSGITSSAGKSVVFTRDSQGRITQIKDPLGNALKYAYSAAGDLATFTDRAGNTTTFTYDPTHLLTNIVNPAGVQAIKSVYDASGKLISITDASGNTTNFTHSLAINQEAVQDALGNTTIYTYDQDGNVTQTIDALGNVTSFTYDANDNQLSTTDPLGHTTSFTYDAAGNQTSVTDALGNTTNSSFNSRKLPLTVKDPLGHVMAGAYDANGNLLSTTDPLGNMNSYTYNAQGLLQTQTDPLGNAATSVYDAGGNLTQLTDPLGNAVSSTYDANNNELSRTVTRTKADGTKETLTTQYQYDGSGRLIKTTNPDGTTTQTVYNAIGQRSDTIDALGHKTHYDYDANGRVLKTTYPDGTTESTTYDADGNRLTFTDRANRTTSFAYDADNRLIKTTYPDGSTTQSVYDAASRVIKTIDGLGNVTQKTYDSANRYLSTTDALGHVTNVSYDAAGNQLSITDALNHTTQFTYDAANRRVQTIYPDTTTVSIGYDKVGRVISRTDQAGNLTQYGFDADGHHSSVTDALGEITKYGYDEVGNRISQTDASNHTTSFAYDQLGRRISRTLPLGMSESYSYDAAGNMISKTDFNGHTTTYTYDTINRLTQKTADPFFSAGSCAGGACGATQVTYTYNPTGTRASMTDASGTTSYTYDKRDRLLTKASPEGTLGYSYDAAGNMLSLKSSNTGGASMTYTYDALNRLSFATDPSGTTQYTYDAVGNLLSFNYPNGVASNYTYNTLNRLTNIQTSCDGTASGCAAPGTQLASYAYTLGPAGNRLSVAELSGRTVQYTYDNLYRLTSETISGAASQNGAISYTYDAVGNRKQASSTVPAIPSGVLNYDANDRLTADTYDANGNTINTGGIADSYDFENHLIQRGGVTIIYDGDGTRVAETVAAVTTNYLVADLNPTGFAQVVDELQSGAVSRTYSYGLELIDEQQSISGTPTTSFYGYDGHGSVRFLTNSTASVTDTYDYDAFGNLINSTGSTPNNYLFAGEQFDPALGIYYSRARYYDQRRGRFWTMDTFEGDNHDPLSLHKYLYAEANPVDHRDPSGNQIDDLAVSFAISSTLDSISGLILNSPLGSSIASFVASLFIPKDCLECLLNKPPDALEVGVYGQVTLNLRNPVLGATGYGGFEYLHSFHNSNSALYGYIGAGVTFGNTTSGGGVGGNVGVVWNTPSSDAYEGPFEDLSIPAGGLGKATLRVQALLASVQPGLLLAGGIPVAYANLITPLLNINVLQKFSADKSVTVFWTPQWAPGTSASGPHSCGANYGGSVSTAIGSAAPQSSGWAFTVSNYWQLWPDHPVPF